MAQDATGTPTSLGIPKYNTAVDAPSGKGFNAAMDAIDVLIAALPTKPAGIVTGETIVYNGTTFVRSSVTKIDAGSLGTGTPDSTKFLRGDGSWQVVAAGSLLGMQIFTVGGTYTPTSGTTRVWIEAIGGGGGSGGVAAAGTQGAASGGGGGGAYAAKFLTSNFSGKTIVIGAGGTGGAAGNNTGGDGGDTTFDSTIAVAKGGKLSLGAAAAAVSAGGAGGLASGSTGDLKIDGQAGQEGRLPNAATPSAGNGGDSGMGFGAGRHGGGYQLAAAAAGTIGYQYGGGASGAWGNNSSPAAQAGAAGATGLVRIWEFA